MRVKEAPESRFSGVCAETVIQVDEIVRNAGSREERNDPIRGD